MPPVYFAVRADGPAKAESTGSGDCDCDNRVAHVWCDRRHVNAQGRYQSQPSADRKPS